MAKLDDKDLYSSIIKKVIAKELTQKEAALKLEISDRQVRRIIVKYKTIGEEALFIKMLVNLVITKKSQMIYQMRL